MWGTLLTHWTIRVALSLYALALAIELRPVIRKSVTPGDGSTDSHAQAPRSAAETTADLRCWLWTAACIAFLAHVACAFHFYHGWSHQSALDDTARQTRELMGVAFGRGIWFSYAFALLWVADVLWWWSSSASYQHRSTWLHGAIHGYMFFIALNGAIVFESGVTRWLGIPVTLLLAVLWLRRRTAG